MFQHRTPINRLLNMKLLAGSKAVEATATGNPLTFVTDLARPLKSLLIPFTPQQSGTGDPSPENIRSILPWNGLTVFGGGKNLLNPATIRKQGNDNLLWYEQDGLFLPAGTYCFTFARNMTGFYVIDANTGTNLRSRYNSATDKFTLTEDHFIKINVYVSGGVDIDEEAMLEAGSTASAYTPFVPITDTDISFSSPVYGGEHEAVSGRLLNGWKVETLDDVNAWTDGGTFISYSNHVFTDRKVGDSFIGVCSAFPIKNNVPSGTAYMRWGGVDAPNILIAPNGSSLTLEDVKTLSGQGEIVLCYPLTTPTEQTLTGHQITALVGDNTIWSDADGSMTAVYFKKG